MMADIFGEQKLTILFMLQVIKNFFWNKIYLNLRKKHLQQRHYPAIVRVIDHDDHHQMLFVMNQKVKQVNHQDQKMK